MIGEYINSFNIKSEDGAETVEIIIGIVVFVIFGLTVFGMITNTAGKKTANVSNCFANYEEMDNKYWSPHNIYSTKSCVNTQYVGEHPDHASYN